MMLWSYAELDWLTRYSDAQKGMASQEGKWEYAPLTIDGGHIPWLASPEITVQTVMKAVA